MLDDGSFPRDRIYLNLSVKFWRNQTVFNGRGNEMFSSNVRAPDVND